MVRRLQKLLQGGGDPGLIVGEAFDCPRWNGSIHTEVNVLCDTVSHDVNVMSMPFFS